MENELYEDKKNNKFLGSLFIVFFAPKDEYNDEICKIENFVKKNRDVEALSKYLGLIFDTGIIFEEEKKDFLKIAKIILGLD